MRGKRDDDKRWYICFVLFLVSIYLSSVFLGSKPLLTTVADTMQLMPIHKHPNLLLPMQTGYQAIGVDRRWRRGTGSSRGVLEDL